jgi:hypothetical protein
MLLIKKHYKKIICAVLCLILLTGFSITGLFNSNKADFDFSARQIDVEQMTYGEKVETLINQFNSYEAKNTATTISFDGDMFASVGEILGFDSLSNLEDEVVKKFATTYDYETNTFYMNVSYYSGDILLESVEAEVEPMHDEARDDGYIEYEGQRFYFSESFDVDTLNECIAGVDDLVVVGVGAVIVCGILITMAVTPPSVHQEIIRNITYVVETVVQAVKSFWGWFTRWVTQIFTRTKAVESTTIITTKTPTLQINGSKIETKAITKEAAMALPKTAYYLAFADPTNNLFYVSIVNIQKSIAIAIMAAPMVTPCIANTSYTMVASVYTIYETSAIHIMDQVGYNARTPKYSPEEEKGFFHYHSVATIIVKSSKYPNGSPHSPHMFFNIQI